MKRAASGRLLSERRPRLGAVFRRTSKMVGWWTRTLARPARSVRGRSSARHLRAPSYGRASLPNQMVMIAPPLSCHALVVDDGFDDRAGLRRMLLLGSEARCTFGEAGTGEHALEACRRAGARGFDVMLLADSLPDMSAPEVLLALAHEHGEIPCAVVVVISKRDTWRGALQAGAHGYIDRSWLTPESLSRVVETVQARFHVEQELRDTRRRLEASEALARERLDEIEALYATAPVGLCLGDTRLRFVHVNAMIAEMNGVPAPEHIGRTPHDVLPRPLADTVVAAMRRVLETGEKIVDVELRTDTHRAPGVARDYLVSWIPFRGRDGVIRGVNTVVQDVTALKEAERELRRREERLRLACEVAHVGWWDWDIGTGRISVAEDLHVVLGFSPDQIPKTYAEFIAAVHPEDRTRVEQAIAATMEHGAPYEVEFRFVGPDGSIRWAATKARPQRDAAGEVQSLLGIDLDITARKESEARREALLAAEHAARKESERIGRLKDEFLATLSHELRTPLNAILGWSQMLRGRTGEAQMVEKAVDVIARNAQVQAQLVDDLLDMNRIISGKLHLAPRPTSVREVVRSALDTVRLAATSKGIGLEAELDLDAEVHGDPDRLQQALWNLLSNAVKFTARGGTVRVAVTRSESLVAVSVQDTGQGIPAEFLPHVFDRFRQADASASRRHGGLGLGLAIVRSIAELHGGTVRVDSEGPGRGSTFTLLLPARGAPAGAQEPRSAEPVAEEASSPDVATPIDACLAGMRVLVVDDEPDARELVERVLTERGAEVMVASGAEEALAALDHAVVDVLIADIGMPEVDGYELARRLRLRDPSRGGAIPALALTAFAREEDRARALATGYDDHLGKPVEAFLLVAAVATMAKGVRLPVSTP
jgi:PAS domain S-box-containing protein